MILYLNVLNQLSYQPFRLLPNFVIITKATVNIPITKSLLFFYVFIGIDGIAGQKACLSVAF